MVRSGPRVSNKECLWSHVLPRVQRWTGTRDHDVPKPVLRCSHGEKLPGLWVASWPGRCVSFDWTSRDHGHQMHSIVPVRVQADIRSPRSADPRVVDKTTVEQWAVQWHESSTNTGPVPCQRERWFGRVLHSWRTRHLPSRDRLQCRQIG